MELIAWVCRSPRRLVVASVIVVAALLAAGSLLIQSGGGTSVSALPGKKPSAAPTATVAAEVPDANLYAQSAVSFVRLWSKLKPGETTAQWQAALVPLTTNDLGLALRSTDPATLPNAAPAGEPVVRFLAQTSAMIAVPLVGGNSVLVTLVTGATGPLVSDIQPDAGN